MDGLQPGYRRFVCQCGNEWSEPTRDYRSPSGEACARCDEWCTPIARWADGTLPVNVSGNLIGPQRATPASVRQIDAQQKQVARELG
jgi:hypothetical protein